MKQYAIAEIRGVLVQTIPSDVRKTLSSEQFVACPFDGKECKKKDHVCSIRQFADNADFFDIKHPIVAICPRRLHQDNTVHNAIQSMFITTPERLPEFPLSFRHRDSSEEDNTRLDYLYVSDSMLLGVEFQTVYFSGSAMSEDIKAIMESCEEFPLPVGHRHPDFKSSSHKRLWPQLDNDWKLLQQQRTGIPVKLAVVVDQSFFDTLPYKHSILSFEDAEVIWIVVNFVGDSSVHLETKFRYTTFEATKRLFTENKLNCRKFHDRVREYLHEIY